MSKLSNLQDDSLKRNKSLTRIDRVRSFLGKKGKTQSLISFFDQNSSIEKVSSYQYTKRSSQIITQPKDTRSSLLKNRRTQSQILEKKEVGNLFGMRSPSLYASRLLTSSKESPPASKKVERLYTPPSMSFPAHLCCQSQAAGKSIGRVTLSSSPPEVSQPFSFQPWWDSEEAKHNQSHATQLGTAMETPPSFILTAHSNSIQALGVDSQDDIGYRCQMPSRSSSCLLPLLDSLNPCFEISICSDSSYATCPTPLLDENSSEGGSTPTLLTESPQMHPTVKDACQSPLAESQGFAKSSFDDFIDVSDSIEDWSQHTDGLVVESFDNKVNRFIEADQPGRQERLRQYTSQDSLKQAPSFETSCASGKGVKQQLSLTDFLHELRNMPREAEEQLGDVSLASSIMNEEEVDSVQICRAWRQNIAFSNLGASHKNKSLQDDHMEIAPAAVVAVSSRPISQKPSRVSLRSTPLDTIEEMTSVTFDSDLDGLGMTSMNEDPNDPIDLCAHLLQRAKVDLMKRQSA